MVSGTALLYGEALTYEAGVSTAHHVEAGLSIDTMCLLPYVLAHEAVVVWGIAYEVATSLRGLRAGGMYMATHTW
jgi:hypothetical protein